MKRIFSKASYDTKTGSVEMLYRSDFVDLPTEQKLYLLQQVGGSAIEVYRGVLGQMLKSVCKPRAARKMSRAIH